MLDTAPQLLAELAHIVCLWQAACGQFHMSFWRRYPLMFRMPLRALDCHSGFAGTAANAAVADVSRAAVTIISLNKCFSIGDCLSGRSGLRLRSDVWPRGRAEISATRGT